VRTFRKRRAGLSATAGLSCTSFLHRVEHRFVTCKKVAGVWPKLSGLTGRLCLLWKFLAKKLHEVASEFDKESCTRHLRKDSVLTIILWVCCIIRPSLKLVRLFKHYGTFSSEHYAALWSSSLTFWPQTWFSSCTRHSQHSCNFEFSSLLFLALSSLSSGGLQNLFVCGLINTYATGPSRQFEDTGWPAEPVGSGRPKIEQLKIFSAPQNSVS